MSCRTFSSEKSEKRWVDQLNKNFIIYVDNPPTIFHVPKPVRDTNPDAFTPQKIGIGAYHHFRIDKRRLAAVKKFLKPEQFNSFKSLIVDKVAEQLDAEVRACYNQYLDIDGDTLAWIMAIDGIYLLHLLKSYSAKKSIGIEDGILAQDILMVENQMPCIVLKQIRKALWPTSPEAAAKDKDAIRDEETTKKECDLELFSQMYAFCKAHSPLELTENVRFVDDTSNPHLLHYMYSLIVKNWFTGEMSQNQRGFDDDPEDEVTPFIGDMNNNSAWMMDMNMNMNGFLDQLESSGEAIENGLEEVAGSATQLASVAAGIFRLKAFMLLANLPVKQFADLFKKGYQKKNYLLEEIQIPSASEIHEVCKIEFKVWSNSGIAVHYNDKERVLYLPVITLNADSEVILRNLVAYEALSGSSCHLISGYVDFMCGIIDTPKDAELLKKKGIINSNLKNEEIARMFNGIAKSTCMDADIEGTVEKLKSIDDNVFSVKAWRFVKAHFVPSKTVVKCFLATLMVLLLTLQAFCEIYGCNARSNYGKMISSFR
ncbi:OLC1v1008114C1 [Oldenlandia corymbosa var. corymbosa]|uniref:OLC1v1008114C1 n=1 Tax=Oldenlandia corymbosa var. corymbosa TaxID=529605 RepID=A0AAV1DLC7_OLDCO|nr:OLC1v1008114C1 [Oldenlandia corymbosa var. corymbosa]